MEAGQRGWERAYRFKTTAATHGQGRHADEDDVVARPDSAPTAARKTGERLRRLVDEEGKLRRGLERSLVNGVRHDEVVKVWLGGEVRVAARAEGGNDAMVREVLPRRQRLRRLAKGEAP